MHHFFGGLYKLPRKYTAFLAVCRNGEGNTSFPWQVTKAAKKIHRFLGG
jgi:hypothetical protein